MDQLPSGTVTLLFTDIEGSTRLLQRLGKGYAEVLRECRRLLRMAFRQGHGYEVDTQGDAFFVAFERASDAVAAAIVAQRALGAAQWPDEATVRVRIGMHTGEPQPADEGYVGLDVHCAARIMSVAHGGQVLLSEATCEVVAHDLPGEVSLRDLGEYRLKDIPGLNRLYQLVIEGLPADFPPLATANSRQRLSNLPTPGTTFIGREQELAAVATRLRRADVRLLTLIGTAGVGKTRLALQVASQLTDEFEDGVCFVGLEQAGDAEAVLPLLAQALDIQEEKGQPLLEQVKATLHEQALLLVLDNFEQVLPARRVIADVLAGCPKLKMLVTSRVILHMQAEHLFEVFPLRLPDQEHLPDVEVLAHNAAVALFVQRAQAVQPDFELTPFNGGAVVDICARLDGIPLAIELAAARMRHFTAQTLLARLAQGLAFLRGKAPDAPARQQTLQEAITWSYNLLTEQEQGVFRRFAVFVQGATLEAARVVCAAAGALEGDVEEALEGLVDQSMLQRHERDKGEQRFWLLQTLREYGLERLANAEEMEGAQAAHAEYYVTWIEQAVPLLLGAEQADWLDRLDQDYENIRAAGEWLIERAHTEVARAEQALRLCVALLGYWEIRGYLGEGLGLVERALQESEDVAATLRAQALHGAGFLALMLDNSAQAENYLRESQLLFRESGDKAGMANILRLQGSLAMVKSRFKLARRLLEEALTIFKELGDAQKCASARESLVQVAIAQCDYTRAHALIEENQVYFRATGRHFGTAYSLYDMACVLFLSREDLGRARALAEECLQRSREVGSRRLMAYALSLLGQILLLEHEETRARDMLEESSALFKKVEDRSGMIEALLGRARVAAAQGEWGVAREGYQESWSLLQAIDAKMLSALCLEGCGVALLAQGEASRAVRLWGTAAALRAAILAPMPPVYRTGYVHVVAIAREQLGDEGFRVAWEEGRRMPVEAVEMQRD